MAVKRLQKGMDSEDIERRFRNERQILAAAEHANIATLYDGGTTDDGGLYFVMELIEGPPSSMTMRFASSADPERLELFRKVCAAVRKASPKGNEVAEPCQPGYYRIATCSSI